MPGAVLATPPGSFALPALGVGLVYTPALPAALYRKDSVDFAEITPDTLCRARRDGAYYRMDLAPDLLDRARAICGDLPISVHGVELSIGSTHGMNMSYLTMLDEFQCAWPFAWHSEHLSFQTFRDADGVIRDTGVPLPLQPTNAAARMVASRCRKIATRYGVPFLLENPVHYLPELPADPAVGDDAGLMERIAAASGCGQLLDLHNVYCNAMNFGFDGRAIIERMPLERVGEIHIAGGSWSEGFRVDAHDNAVPEEVWELLDYTLPRCANVAGVVFESLDVHVGRVGADTVAADLARASSMWRASRPRVASVSCH
jgi:uncharacterized protein (UPF0276 family)